MTNNDLVTYEWMLITGEEIRELPSSKYAEQLTALSAGDFEKVLNSPFAKSIFGIIPDDTELNDFDWTSHIERRIASVDEQDTFRLLLFGIAALNAFVQSNITGPPLPFNLPQIVLGRTKRKNKKAFGIIREKILKSLSVEGDAAYNLIPDVILFALAKLVLNNSIVLIHQTARWWRLRVNFLHQKLLDGDKTHLLHDLVYDDANYLARPEVYKTWPGEARIVYLVEKALIDAFFGYDKVALEELKTAGTLSGLKYTLTGMLGKRTKFQEKDTSQLVVLAKSRADKERYLVANGNENVIFPQTKPKTLDLNDDTLLERIEFSSKTTSTSLEEKVSDLPPELIDLDPNNQPPLHPLDACIFLLMTEAIKNTNPASGITREEMEPYAERILQHSTNWEVHTIGLLIRSRIEGYKSRTAERSVLQLQALVDQLIAETTSAISSKSDEGEEEEEEEGEDEGSQKINGNAKRLPTTFLPAPTEESQSAPVRDRLLYVYQLPAPTRWELEAELANRWVALGGLRTALEIYERLEMWAEVALCWAATEREDKARKVIRDQLFLPITPPADWKSGEEYTPTREEEDTREERYPAPNNAPRLWCILGDIDNNPNYYNRSWEVSGGRYARAKRSLGKYYFSKKEYMKSAEAYTESLRINALNEQSWFALGCCRMELEDWEGAVECFSRSVSLDDQDAEGWSNLASALLRRRTALPPQREWKYDGGKADEDEKEVEGDDESSEVRTGELVIHVRKNRLDALKALRRACSLKYESWKIWENFLIIAASVNEYDDVVLAMKRLIELQGKSKGENCIDVEILERLVRHVITVDLDKNTSSSTSTSTSALGPSLYTEQDRIISQKKQLQKSIIELIDKYVVPIITKNERLWLVVAKMALWRSRPTEALNAYEKGFRAVSHGFDVGERKWEELVDMTGEMVSAYESLGQLEKEGLGSGSETVVMKDWRFKVRTTIRGVIGKGRKAGYEDTEGMRRLEGLLEGSKKNLLS